LQEIYSECIPNIVKTGWRTSVVDMNEGTSGGFKEVIFEVTGEDVYGTLKFEAGAPQRATNRNSRTCAYISSDCYGIARSRGI
jgi:protein subunit release factor A